MRSLRNRVVTCHSIKTNRYPLYHQLATLLSVDPVGPHPPEAERRSVSLRAPRLNTRRQTSHRTRAFPVPACRAATCRRRSGPSPRYPRYPPGLTPTGPPRCAVSSTTRDALIRDVRSSSRRTQQYLLGREASRPERKAPSKRAPFHQVGRERGQGATSFLATTTRRQGYAARGS